MAGAFFCCFVLLPTMFDFLLNDANAMELSENLDRARLREQEACDSCALESSAPCARPWTVNSKLAVLLSQREYPTGWAAFRECSRVYRCCRSRDTKVESGRGRLAGMPRLLKHREMGDGNSSWEKYIFRGPIARPVFPALCELRSGGLPGSKADELCLHQSALYRNTLQTMTLARIAVKAMTGIQIHELRDKS